MTSPDYGPDSTTGGVDLDRIAARHEALWPSAPPNSEENICEACDWTWPCDATVLVAEVRRLREAVRLLQDNWPKTVPAPMDRS